MEDGVLLLQLLTAISNKKLDAVKGNSKFHKLQNCNTAISFCTKEGIKLVGIGAEDLVEKNEKLILGFIWTLILRWQMNVGDEGEKSNSAKNDLLKWVKFLFFVN